MSSTVPAIESHGLTRTFGGTRAVDGVDLSVAAGEVFGLLGTNGAGKTTTVRMLATLARPDAGTARIFGHDVVEHQTAVRSLIGVTGQYASVDEDLTARENLMIFSRLVGYSRRRARLRADELLDEFGLGSVAMRRVGHYSGGMRRRLDLAASLITRPRLLFLDEPTTGLDPRTRAQMWQTVRELVSRGSTVLLTTQYLDEADALADRIAVMDRGRVVAVGTADELKAEVGDRSVRLALADPTDIPTAAAVCAPFTSTRGVTVAEEEPVLTLPMDDLDPLVEVLAALRAQGISLTSVNVVHPSLDEVFFAVTSGSDPRAGRRGTAGAKA